MANNRSGKAQSSNNGRKDSKTERSPISISDKIQIVIAVFTLFSLIGLIFTLLEMRKDRDAAYKPTILINAANFQVSWNTNGEEEWLSSLPNESNNNYEINEDGSITGTLSLPVSIFQNNGMENITAVNIGVGPARDICFEWDRDNLLRLSKCLAGCDPSKSDFCSFDKSVAFSFDERLVVTDIDQDFRLMYMLPNAQETYTLTLPTAYSILIHEIMKYGALPELTYIVLYAEYFDVQGKSVRDTFFITLNRTHYESAEDNSGTATYQLTPTLLIT